MSKHPVTMFCGHQALGHNPAQKYCNKKCVGFHVKRSKTPKPDRRRRKKKQKPYLPSDNPLWDRAKAYKTSNGYIMLYAREPETGQVFSRMQHIVVWERAYGMRVPYDCCLHHLNNVPDDNRAENILCMPISLHMKMHTQIRKLVQLQLSTVQFIVERHAIILDFLDKTKEIMANQNRWKHLSSQKGWR